MRRLPVALVLALTLASCAPSAAVVTEAVLSPADLAKLQQTCTAAQPILAAGTSASAPATVSSIAAYGAAYCAQLAGGTVPPTTNANTPSWLSSILNAAQVAARVVGMVMPLVALF